MDLSNPSEMMPSSDEFPSSSEEDEIPGPSNPHTDYISEISRLKRNGISELASLGVCAYDHSELEKEILEKEKKKRREKDSRDLKEVEEEIQKVQVRLCHIEHAISVAPRNLEELESTAKKELQAIKVERQIKNNFLKTLAARRYNLQVRICGSSQVGGSSTQEDGPVETERERLIRTGEITPFGSRIISITDNTAFDRFLLNSTDVHESKKASSKKACKRNTNRVVIKNDKLYCPFTDLNAVPAKKSKNKLLNIQNECGEDVCERGPAGADGGGVLHARPHRGQVREDAKKRSSPPKKRKISRKSDSEESCSEGEQEEENDNVYSDSDVYIPTKEEEDYDDDDDDDDYNETGKGRKGGPKKKAAKLDDGGVSGSRETKSKVKKLVDDGNQASYLKRINFLEPELPQN